MKKGLSGSLALLVVGLLFWPFSIVFAQDVTSVVNANNQFAFELDSKYKSKDGNISTTLTCAYRRKIAISAKNHPFLIILSSSA